MLGWRELFKFETEVGRAARHGATHGSWTRPERGIFFMRRGLRPAPPKKVLVRKKGGGEGVLGSRREEALWQYRKKGETDR